MQVIRPVVWVHPNYYLYLMVIILCWVSGESYEGKTSNNRQSRAKSANLLFGHNLHGDSDTYREQLYSKSETHVRDDREEEEDVEEGEGGAHDDHDVEEGEGDAHDDQHHLHSRAKLKPHRAGKLFSVFSIVSFPNEACISSLDNTNGTCLSPSDCRIIGGANEGSCASGFGVCCVVRLGTCGGVVTTNVTLLQNPNYPSSYGSSGTCVYLVKRLSEGICQLRLDFDKFSMGYSSSSPTGCITGSTDILSFTAQNSVSYPSVCGDISGQHMYFDAGTTGDSLELTFSLVGSTTARQWNILVSQIACTDPWRAPADCLQYHTGVQGNIMSFNFPNGQILSSQAYRICFRQELDYCKISYTASLVTKPDPFELNTGTTGTTTTLANCQVTYLGIPQGGDSGNMDSKANRYCGAYFDSSEGATRNGQVTSSVAPFDLFVFSDAAPVTADKSALTGFNLNFHQKLCNAV